MNRTPSAPPVIETSVVVQKSNSDQTPAMMSAGIVKMMPAASDSPADAIVWTMLFSSTVPERSTPRRIPMEMTAAGMEALTVIPSFKPR